MNRRKFLGMLGGGAAAAIVPTALLASPSGFHTGGYVPTVRGRVGIETVLSRSDAMFRAVGADMAAGRSSTARFTISVNIVDPDRLMEGLPPEERAEIEDAVEELDGRTFQVVTEMQPAITADADTPGAS